MKAFYRFSGLGLALASLALGLFVGTVFSTRESSAQSQSAITYNPPRRGAPASRVGSGGRGLDVEVLLSVFAPDHPGLTTHTSPRLYWYLSNPQQGHHLEIAVLEAGRLQSEPLYKRQLQLPKRGGVMSVALAGTGLALRTDVEYEWLVALVLDPERGSSDIVAGGVITRMTADRQLQQRLAAAPVSEHAKIYASQGIWYDAIMSLGEQIGANPADRGLREQRAVLLDQVGLRAAAAYDRGR